MNANYYLPVICVNSCLLYYHDTCPLIVEHRYCVVISSYLQRCSKHITPYPIIQPRRTKEHSQHPSRRSLINTTGVPRFSKSLDHYGFIPQPFLTYYHRLSLTTANMPTQTPSATAPRGTESPTPKSTVMYTSVPQQDMIIGEQKRILDEFLHHLLAATEGLRRFPLSPFPPQSTATIPSSTDSWNHYDTDHDEDDISDTDTWPSNK